MTFSKRCLGHLPPDFLATDPASHHVIDNLVELRLGNLPHGMCTLAIYCTVLIASFRIEVVMDGIILVNVSILAVLLCTGNWFVICLAIIATLLYRLLYL